MTPVRVAAIVGATGVGKTERAMQIAPQIGAEIVSVDSRQIYRGMDIGTAKPSASMRAEVPHHLIDVFEPSHEVTVSEFQTPARDAVGDIASRGRRPLLVGGSGLYFRAVVDDLRFPPRSKSVRQALELELEKDGSQRLHAKLAARDPQAAANIESSNGRRIVRALEVIEITGRPFSENNSGQNFDSIYDLVVAGLTMPRPQLYARLADRIDNMLDQGLIAEAKALERNGLGRNARQALGYKQVLDAPPGAGTEEIRGDILMATKRFVRRQESWFRSDPRIMWFDANEPSLVERLTELFTHRREAVLPPIRGAGCP
ncbi:MAG: tRNA dimethylallyltransferase [Actinomycetota bacterium]|nr:tRNA dimethylallyltransferase [Actinomycetota bacterium]